MAVLKILLIPHYKKNQSHTYYCLTFTPVFIDFFLFFLKIYLQKLVQSYHVRLTDMLHHSQLAA
jgi:hypothetical protein